MYKINKEICTYCKVYMYTCMLLASVQLCSVHVCTTYATRITQHVHVYVSLSHFDPGCKSMEVLQLSQVKVSDRGVQQLLHQPLEHLSQLDLSNTLITSRSLALLTKGLLTILSFISLVLFSPSLFLLFSLSLPPPVSLSLSLSLPLSLPPPSPFL